MPIVLELARRSRFEPMSSERVTNRAITPIVCVANKLDRLGVFGLQQAAVLWKIRNLHHIDKGQREIWLKSKTEIEQEPLRKWMRNSSIH